MTVMFWIIVTVAPFYLYQQYVQPLVEKLSAPEAATNGFQLPTSVDVQKLINSLKGGQ